AGLLAFEGASVPEQVDALAFPPGHETREAARGELTRPGYFAERVPAAALTGIMAGTLGNKLGKVITPEGRPELGAAREVLDRGSDASIRSARNLNDYRSAIEGPKRPLLEATDTPRASPEPARREIPAPKQRAIPAPKKAS